MSCPLGETGVGKMGEIPPSPSQELRRKAAATRPRIVSGNRPRCFTAQSLSEHEARDGRRKPIESKTDSDGSEQASLCRCIQPEPCRGLPALRAEDGTLHRHVPQLRLQALALQSR